MSMDLSRQEGASLHERRGSTLLRVNICQEILSFINAMVKACIQGSVKRRQVVMAYNIEVSKYRV